MVNGINGTGNALYLAQMRQVMKGASGIGNLGRIDTAASQTTSKKSGLSLDAVFGKIDADGDGVISKDEFEKAKIAMEGKISEALASFQSGSTASLLNLLQSTTQAHGMNGVNNASSSDQLFSGLDANSDGVITRTEFEKANTAFQNGLSDLKTAVQTEVTSPFSTQQGTGSDGATAGSNPIASQQTIIRNAVAMTNLRVQQAMNQYRQLAQAGQTVGTIPNLMFTG